MNSVYSGTWQLEAFTITHAEKGTRDWGTNVRGLLIYSATGHVSVAINRDITSATADIAPSDKQLLGAKLFYAGTFSVNGSVITHLMRQFVKTNESR